MYLTLPKCLNKVHFVSILLLENRLYFVDMQPSNENHISEKTSQIALAKLRDRFQCFVKRAKTLTKTVSALFSNEETPFQRFR